MAINKYQTSFVDKNGIESNLNTIIQLLREYSHSGQAEYMNRILETLHNDDKPGFVELSKTVDIWGGSGAVWEVWIQDRNKEKEFQIAMIKFAGLLIANGINSYGIRSIKTLFENEVKKK